MRTDVIFSWFMAGEFAKVESLFQRPVRHIAMPIPAGQKYGAQFESDASWPHPLYAMIQRAGLTPETVGRIALMGFSQGCQGVRMILKSQDAGLVEHAMAFDGIHGNWEGGAPNAGRGNIHPASLGPWIAFADAASRGAVAIGDRPPARRYCTITHSSIVPDFPSTTETSRAILNKLFGSGWPKPQFHDGCSMTLWHNPPVRLTPSQTGKTVSYDRSANTYWAGQHGLVVAGYSNVDPTGSADHVYQGNVLPAHVLRCQLIERWNAIDPNLPNCGAPSASPQLGVAGPGCNPEAPLIMGPRPVDASLPYEKYFDPGYQPRQVEELPTLGEQLFGLAAGAAGGAAATWAAWRAWRAWQWWRAHRRTA